MAKRKKHPLDCPIPKAIVDKLRVLDAAARNHYADCWGVPDKAGSISNPDLIAARYHRYEQAKKAVQEAVSAWTSRHAEEFHIWRKSGS